MDDEQLERRMRDWRRAEREAREAERAARTAAPSDSDVLESPKARAARLRRLAETILASILEDMHLRGVGRTSSLRATDSESSPS